MNNRLKIITTALFVNIVSLSILFAENNDADIEKSVYITSENNVIKENDTVYYKTDYTFLINAPGFDRLITKECSLEILTNDGKNYKLISFPGSSAFPFSFVVNLPSGAVIPEGYDWKETIDGMFEARIYYEGLDVDDGFRSYEADFYFFIPYDTSMGIIAPLSDNTEIPIMNVYASGNDLSLTFETTSGIPVEKRIKKMEVININGSVIMTAIQDYLPGTNIDIMFLQRGLYIVRVTDDTNNSYVGKFRKP